MAKKQTDYMDKSLVDQAVEPQEDTTADMSGLFSRDVDPPQIMRNGQTPSYSNPTPRSDFQAGAGGANGAAANGAPTYAGTYEEQLAQLYDQITGRDPFSYNVNMDPIYQNYKDQYIQGGKRAMQDTMGQAAGLTGGYGSTYSQAAGQQAYDQYLTQLTNKIPELYEMAYGMYKDQGDQLTQQYGMLNDLRATEYNQWRDAMSDYNYDRELQRQAEETAYQHQQDAYSKIIAMIQATGYNPTNAELAAAGMTRRQADKLREAYKKAQRTGSGGSGGGGGGSRGRGSSSGGSGTGGGGTATTTTDVRRQATAAYESGQISYEEYMTILNRIGSTSR